MIQNIIETDTHEALDLLNASLFIHIALYSLIPVIFIIKSKIHYKALNKEILYRATFTLTLFIISSSAIFFSYKDISFVGREHRDLRYYINPVYPIISLYKYIKISNKPKTHKIEVVFNDATKNNDLSSNKNYKVLILIVGETARASSFGINDYHRDTTPLLKNKNILNFSNTFSCGTATAESLPCMFSDINKDQFEKSNVRYRENLLDALSYADFDVLWRENNSGCKGVCDRFNTQVMHEIVNTDICNNESCYDEVLLYNLKTRLKNIHKDTVIVLHQQGSHGPAYYRRVPLEFEKFSPQCKTNDVQNCSKQQVINSYDNTILYTDFLISSVIDILKASPENMSKSMIYISDHGESLGEKGIYLHGLPYFMAPEEQKHIPFIVWLSKQTIQSKNIDYSCLKGSQSFLRTHDNLIHSVLGLMDISTNKYNKNLDIFSNCKTNIAHQDDENLENNT